MRKLLVFLFALTFVGVQIPAVLAQEASPTPLPVEVEAMKERALRGEICSWPVEVAVDALNVVNAFLPDALLLRLRAANHVHHV